MTNSQPSDQIVSTETQLNDTNKPSRVYLFIRLSLLGLISVFGAVSIYYFHSDIVATVIVSAGSTLTLLPIPSIIKSTFDFFKNKKSEELEKDKKLLIMAIKEEVKTQQSSFGDDLREVLSISRTVQNSFESIRQEIEGVKLEIEGVKLEIESVKLEITSVENRFDARFNLIDARFNNVDAQLIEIQRQTNAGFTETHNDIRRLEQQTSDQINAIRQISNPQE